MNNVVDDKEDNPFLENSNSFVSTQMQGRLEDIENEYYVQDAQQAKLSELDKFKLFNTSLCSSVDTKPSLRRKVAVVKPKKKKKISVTNLMKEKYSKVDLEESLDAKDKLTQFTICLFYSGKKGKVQEIMQRIEREEGSGRHDVGSVSEDQLKEPTPDLQDMEKATYTKGDWNLILKKIKVKFPNLSSKTKKSLQIVNRQISKQLSIMRSGSDTEDSGMWSQQAGTPTQEELDSEDIRWLYSLTDEQVSLLEAPAGAAKSSFSEESVIFDDGPFVTTLSQVMEQAGSKLVSQRREQDIMEETDNDSIEQGEETEVEDEEIPNSSPELSPIRVKSEPSSSSRLEIQESIYQKDQISSHQQESAFYWETPSLPYKGSQERTVELITTSSSPAKQPSEPEEIFSSSMTFNTPQKTTEKPILVMDEIVSSPVRLKEVFKTPLKIINVGNSNLRDSPAVGIVSGGEIEDSPIKLHQEPVGSPTSYQRHSPSSPSVYSTALANFPETVHGIVAPRKRYHTSIVEIPGEIELTEDTGSGLDRAPERVKIRKIGSRIEPPIDSEDEIPDSDEENKQNTSISIIEISREIVEDVESAGNTSIMQVPSSPRNQYGTILESNFLKSESEIEKDAQVDADATDVFSTMTATQLRGSFVKLGLKPVQGKAKMVQTLRELSQHVDLSQSEIDREDFHGIINTKVNEAIRGSRYWHEKVISFEPIILTELQKWLEEGGLQLDLDILERYCDVMGVTTKQEPQEERQKVKRRKSKVKKIVT